MSRGPGKIQQRAIEVLASYPKPTITFHELAAIIHPETPSISRSQYNSVSRAAGGIAERMGWKHWQRGGTAGLQRACQSTVTSEDVQGTLSFLVRKYSGGGPCR